MFNDRERAVKTAVKSAIAEPRFAVLLPWLTQQTWDQLLSPQDTIREGYKAMGRTTLHLGFATVFAEFCGGLEAGFSVGLFGPLENCLLSEEIFFELFKKPAHRGVDAIAAKGGGTVADAVHIFIGGLWFESPSLGKVLPFVRSVFGALLPVAVDAFDSFRKSKRAKQAKTGGGQPTELLVLHRVYRMQIAKKPLKLSKEVRQKYADLMETLQATPSSSFPATPSSSSVRRDQAPEDNLYRDDRPGSLWDSTSGRVGHELIGELFQEGSPSNLAALLAPVSLKRKASPDAERSPPNSPLPATHNPLFYRSPLTPRNRNENPWGSDARLARPFPDLNTEPSQSGASKTESPPSPARWRSPRRLRSPAQTPSPRVPLASSLNENFLFD
ncbi:hypothetical protein DFH06DRAFT_1253365 [Mycena polygramma]|nr:hypothetical protein DFH06DRAFT_1253365 [Mycena polygramma]